MKASVPHPHHYAPSVPQDADSYAGGFHMHAHFVSKILPSPRNVIVYLPPGYEENPTARYATLYMHDGQNLFDGETAYVAGHDWKMARTAERLIVESRIEPLIIVGIWNTGVQRMGEYTPSRDAGVGDGGLLPKYGRLIVEELKPFIDQRYRTKPEREHTGIGGSSLGGLASLLLGLHHSETFSRIAAVSPSLWWDQGVAYRLIQNLKRKPASRIWLDMGTKESSNGVASVRLMRDLLIELGWRLRADLFYHEARGGKHSEADWAKRVGMILRKLYPAAQKSV
jgi:predicted alpha/beta superfamily hydrolase